METKKELGVGRGLREGSESKKTRKTSKESGGVVQNTLFSSDGEEIERKYGAHPVFHDLERDLALRTYAQRASTTTDTAFFELYRLLLDAHERLSRWGESEEELEAKIEGLTSDLESAEEDKEELRERIKILAQDLDAQSSDRRELEMQSDALRKKLDRLVERVAMLERSER